MADLKNEELIVVVQVLSKWRPELIPTVLELRNKELSEEIRNEIRDAIGDEFVTTGLGEEYEPNERGKMLDNLIDRIWDLR